MFHSHQELSEVNEVDGVVGLHVPHYVHEHDYAQKEDEVDNHILLKGMLHASIGEKKVNEKLFLSPGIVTCTIAIKTD